MKIAIIVPYENPELWAVSENEIDFENDKEAACRCTVCFAATEAKRYLERCVRTEKIRIGKRAEAEEFAISVFVNHVGSDSEEFDMIPEKYGITVRAEGRIGALYGIYELLNMQGVHWYEPGEQGAYIPPMSEGLTLPDRTRHYAPNTPLGRGFDFEGMLKEDEDLWLWMARNKLNLAAYRANTYPLLKKLGMQMKVGGHIFEKCLSPDRVLSSGRTLWEEHPEWYGTPAEGKKTKERALSVQFCVSAEGIADFLAEDLIKRLERDWRYADRVDVWNFDSWGGSCCCGKCESLGNATDKNLYFLSQLREKIDAAVHSGRLSHNVRIALCAYEGTLTLSAPLRAVPDNLLKAGDYAVFYPILRCYAHDIDGDCPDNRVYEKYLGDWLKTPLPIMVGEYYNVTKFEDLPILFTDRISHDLPQYIRTGVQGFTYMHLPMLNWGVRTLTHYLYARMSWGGEANPEKIIETYFAEYYGAYRKQMRLVCKNLEKAWRCCAQWRSWSKESIVTQLNFWDGKTPEQPLRANAHFKDMQTVLKEGDMAIGLMEEALSVIGECLQEEKEVIAQVVPSIPYQAVNPIEQEKNKSHSEMESRLCEAMRQLQYGIDVMRLMTETVRYYDASFRCDGAEQEKIWERLQKAELAAEMRYMPLTFGHPKVNVRCKDEMERSQLKPVLRRIRKQRQSDKQL